MTLRAAALVALSLALFSTGAGCHAVKKQAIPFRVLSAKPSSFAPGDRKVAVLHYYGTGGWGIQWKDTYLLTAPYFSNHDYFASSFREAKPNRKAIEAGFDGTPFESTSVILVGHGHVDHAADIPAYPFEKMRENPTLIADRSTIHLLGEKTRDRVCEVPLRRSDANRFLPRGGDCPTGDVRIRPIPWAHAPHEALLGDQVFLTFGTPQGAADEPLAEPPEKGGDWLVGPTWGYVIDLMEGDEPVFRIHYVDAAANPAFVGQEPLEDGRPTNVHIACVPGFDTVQGYPEGVIAANRVRYVLAGHWEDFFRDRSWPLVPVAVLDDSKMNAFVERVEKAIPTPGDGPINKSDCGKGETCGPKGEAWAVPIPGETFWFCTRKPCAPVAPASAAP